MNSAFAAQVGAIIFTSVLQRELAALGTINDGPITPEDSASIVDVSTDEYKKAYFQAVHTSLAAAVAWAALALAFAAMLPWTRLEGGTTKRQDTNPPQRAEIEHISVEIGDAT
jgi:hypothetical protein